MERPIPPEGRPRLPFSIFFSKPLRHFAATGLPTLLMAAFGLAVAAPSASAAGTVFYAYANGAASASASCPQTPVASHECTLAEALSLAGAGSTVALATPCWAGRYVGNWTVATTGTSAAAPVTIGAAPWVFAVLDGNHGSATGRTTATCNGPVLTIGSGVFVDLSGITFQNGYNVAAQGASPTPGAGGGSGGAIENDSGGTVSVSASTFNNNTATDGGAIDNAEGASGTGALSVLSSKFFGNTARVNAGPASDGGAIDNADNGGTGTVSVVGSTFSGNVAGYGAASLSPTASIVYQGGAIASGSNGGTGMLSVSGSTFLGNSAHWGGAIATWGAATVLTSSFTANWASYGGAVNRGAPLTVSASTFSGNTAAGNSGAIDSGTRHARRGPRALIAIGNRRSGRIDKAVSLVFSISELPKVLGPGGGQVVVQASLFDASLCQLTLLSHQDFPVVYAKGARHCVASFKAKVLIGANPSPVDRVVSFELVATHGRYNAIAGPLRTVVPFQIVVLDKERTAYVTRSKSGNWSGYAAEGGPFTSVGASFVVPHARPTRCGEELEQWVGVDGTANTDLVQAGVEESNANPSTGLCAPGRLWVRAWWEVLPAALVPLSMSVHPGDLMDVAVSQLGKHQWRIVVDDATTRASFSRLARYSGPAASVEWIVEAPTVFAWTVPLMPYGFAAFEGLRLNGQVTVLNDLWLVQNEETLSLPNSVPSLSYLLRNGFSVVYAA